MKNHLTFSTDTAHTHHPCRSSDVDENRSGGPVLALANVGAQLRRGVCSQGKTKQWLCLGTVASEKERLGTVKVLTHRKR